MATRSPRRSQPEIHLDPLTPAARAPVEVVTSALPSARGAQIAQALAPDLRRLSALVGLRAFEIESSRLRLTAVQRLLDDLLGIAERWADADHSLPTQTRSAKGTRWRWTRHRQVLMPVHIGRVVLTDESEGQPRWQAGVLMVPVTSLPLSERRLQELLHPRQARGGLCVNWITWRPTKACRLAPQPMEVLDDEGRPTLEGDARAMRQMANAFWQPHWAVGSARDAHGKTFPTAFLPMRRDPEAPLDDHVLETGGSRLLGERSITSAVLQRLASSGKLLYDPGADRFGHTSEKGIGEPELAAIERLNQIGFFERHVAEPPTRPLQVARVVPFQGGAPISDLFVHPKELRATGRVDFERKPLAGLNSLFFLNFPEEFVSPHSALNDPVSTLMIDGVWHSAPLLKRGTLLIDDRGKATIRVTSLGDTVIETPLLPRRLVPQGGPRVPGIPAAVNSPTCPRGGAQIFTPWAVGSSSDGVLKIPSFKPGRDRAFVIVGTEIVEEVLDGEVMIPHSGWVLVMRRTTPGYEDLPDVLPGAMRRVELRWRRAADRRFVHAMACGPVLLAAGKALAADHFARCAKRGEPEEFLAREGRGIEVKRRGVAPTRFPGDSALTRAPRSAVGVTAKGAVILAVVDGRADTRHSIGLTLCELAHLMRDLGCRDALNLDGGGSSVLFLNHATVRRHPLLPTLERGIANRPADQEGAERLIPFPLLLWTK